MSESTQTPPGDELTYDKAMEELEGILEAVEEESISVDELDQKIKRARELIRFCRERLRATEESVNTVLEDMEEEEGGEEEGTEGADSEV